MTDALANNIAGFSSIKRFQLPSSTYNVKVSPKACLDQLRNEDTVKTNMAVGNLTKQIQPTSTY